MNPQLIREVGSHQRLEILTALKRRGGMSVKELAAHFRMSYMGVKGHCLDLEREGFLQTWRHAKGGLGRPELLYRLTRRAHELFPSAGHELTADILEAVQQTYGPAAPAKLLFVVFAQRAEAYRARIAAAGHGNGAGLWERAAALAVVRDAEGYMAEFLPPEDSAAAEARIIERRSPLADLLRRYPIVSRLERELFERTLQCPVRREEQQPSDPEKYACVFHLGAGANHS